MNAAIKHQDAVNHERKCQSGFVAKDGCVFFYAQAFFGEIEAGGLQS